MGTGDALLALLLPGPRHGYDLKRTHDDWFAGLRPLAYGQVYSTLSRLQRDGLVEVAHTETGDGPERVVYRLTGEGTQRAREWVAAPVDPSGAHAEELIRKVLAAYRLHADPHGLMSRQRTEHLRAMRALEPANGVSATAAGPALVADHARTHLDADLRWLEVVAALVRRIPAPSPGGSDEIAVQGRRPEPVAGEEGVADPVDEGARS